MTEDQEGIVNWDAETNTGTPADVESEGEIGGEGVVEHRGGTKENPLEPIGDLLDGEDEE